MKIKTFFIGLLAFFIVLFTMPLGHAAMITMENIFGHNQIYHAALILGLVGMALLIYGMLVKNQKTATFLGLFAGLFVWTGWVEFAFVYYANRFGVQPLMHLDEVVTKPEYLIMPSSVGFLAVIFIFYLTSVRSGCLFFLWLQRNLRIQKNIQLGTTGRNPAIVTFMEMIMILWAFYLLLLFAYDENFAGDYHIITYIIAFGCLLWSAYLFIRLLKIQQIDYAIRYAIPTVIIFWTFIEILGRWGIFEEIWIDPRKFWLEMLLMLFVMVFLIGISLYPGIKHKLSNQN